VKPQAWYDSPAQHLPYTPAPVTAAAGSAPAKRQQGTPDTTAGSDITITPTPEDEGSFITADGVSSSYEVTDKMLADNNFARLEHVTIRVWIDHQRRGDVEVSLESPNGVVSMLAEARRWDEATTGFDGWKFMTLKHW
jgi:kexin